MKEWLGWAIGVYLTLGLLIATFALASRVALNFVIQYMPEEMQARAKKAQRLLYLRDRDTLNWIRRPIIVALTWPLALARASRPEEADRLIEEALIRLETKERRRKLHEEEDSEDP